MSDGGLGLVTTAESVRGIEEEDSTLEVIAVANRRVAVREYLRAINHRWLFVEDVADTRA
jgi:hypothetical protein